MTSNAKRTVYVGKFCHISYKLLPVFSYHTYIDSFTICHSNFVIIILIIYSTINPNNGLLFTGGLADEVDEKVLNNVFLPFGDILDVQIPLDYESEKHRGFAFIEFESAEDAAAAIDNMVNNKKKVTHLFISNCFLKSTLKTN